MNRPLLRTLLAFWAWFVMPAFGAGPLVPAQTQAPFRSSVAVVRLDVAVLDTARTPIRGLRQDDFTVLVDGVEQPLVAVSEVNNLEARSAGVVASSPPGFVSNQTAANRRAFVLILDDAKTDGVPFMIQYTRGAARAFVEGLQPGDLAAVVFTWNGSHNQDFTTDHGRLLDAIDEFRPGPGWRFRPTSAATSRTLRSTVKRLSAVPHLRSAIVLISPGTDIDPDADDRGNNPGMRTISEEDVMSGAEFASAIRQAAYARIPIYAISNHGLRAPRPGRTPFLGIRLGNDDLHVVANSSGGFAVVDTNTFLPGIEQILLENSSHYVVGYQPTYPVDDGRYRRLEIRVRRPEATVFPSGRFIGAPRSVNRETIASPRTAIAGILPIADIPLAARVTVADARSESGEADVAIELAIGPVADPSGQAQIECVAFDAGRLKEIASTAIQIRLANGRVMTRLGFAIQPGRYNLRCGVHAPALNRMGSVYAEMTVPNTGR